MKTTALVPMLFVGSLTTVGAQAAPQGSTGPGTSSMVELGVDLAAAGDSLIELEVRPSQSFTMRLDNRAPAALYRIKADLSLGPDTPRPPAATMNRDYELPPAREAPRGTREGCEEVFRRRDEMLAARDEAAAREKAKAFEGMVGGSVCPELVQAFSSYLKEARKTLVPYYQLKPGDSLRLSMERLDSATNQVARSWRVQVTALAPKLDWLAANEEAWIVGEVSRRIVDMALRARPRSGSAAEAPLVEIAAASGTGVPSYRVTANLGPGARVEASVVPAPYVWAPSAYEPLARRVLASLKLAPGKPGSGTETAATLLTPSSPVMEQENRRISERLASNMLDGRAQGQAALLLASLALREAAGEFSDARPALCRASAHLAMARVLGGGGLEADLAEAALLGVMERQRDALVHLDALEGRAGTSPPAKAWLRALRMRATRDWRLVAEPAKATLLEQIELYRASKRSLGSSLSVDLLDRMSPEFVPDWGRIATSGATVDVGNRFAAMALPVEIADLQQVWKAARGTDLPGPRLADALASKEAASDYRAIEWRVWADFFERHLCHAAHESEQHLNQRLGLPEDAAKVREGAFAGLDGLELRSLLAMRWAAAPGSPKPAKGPVSSTPPVSSEEACRAGVELVRRRPDRVTAVHWQLASKRCWQQREDASLPGITAWFSPALPRGTAYDAAQRLLIGELGMTLGREGLDGLRAMAPFSRTAIAANAGTWDAKLTVAELEAAYGPLAEYDLGAMRALLGKVKDEPDQYRKRAEAIALASPSYYFVLGDHLAARGMDDAAAAAFEKGVEKELDRVAVSGGVGFLVDYYYDKGRTDDALRIARMAADTHSANGLSTLGRLHERMGQYAEAESWYQKVAERYEEGTSLDEFYIRYEQRVGDGKHRAEAKAAQAKLFPQGLEKVSLSDFRGLPEGYETSIPPSSTENYAWWHLGIREGDVVVGIDGYRVQDWKQFGCVQSFNDDPETRMLIWRQGGYLELKGRLVRDRYGPRGPGRRI